MDSILVISPEPSLAETLASELSGFTVTGIAPAEAKAALEKESFRLIITDETSLSLTAAKAPMIALKRPVKLGDLLYTIHEQLQSKSAEAQALGLGWQFSPAEKLLKAPGKEAVSLTAKEAELLASLLESGAAAAREELLKRVWGYGSEVATHTLETHIYRLRGKLHQADAAFDIATSGDGYRLVLP